MSAVLGDVYFTGKGPLFMLCSFIYALCNCLNGLFSYTQPVMVAVWFARPGSTIKVSHGHADRNGASLIWRPCVDRPYLVRRRPCAGEYLAAASTGNVCKRDASYCAVFT